MCAGCIVVEKERVENAQTDTKHAHKQTLCHPLEALSSSSRLPWWPSNNFLPLLPYKCQKISSWGSPVSHSGLCESRIAQKHRRSRREAYFVTFMPTQAVSQGWSGTGLRGAVGMGSGHWRAGALMRQWHQDIHVVDWEEARLAVDHAFVPVVVNLIGQGDDVALLEAQLALVLGLKVIQCPTAWLVQRGWLGGGGTENVG